MRQYDGEDTFDAIYEVYYDDETGKVIGWTENSTSAWADVNSNGQSELKDEIDRFMQALEKPILNWKTGKEINEKQRMPSSLT